jgi:hypothetical protein
MEGTGEGTPGDLIVAPIIGKLCRGAANTDITLQMRPRAQESHFEGPV